MSDYTERLNAVNQLVVFTNIKGKEYAQVNQRILAFWSLFPDGRIETRKLGDDGKRCDFEALAFADRESEKPIATGHAFEYRDGRINSTSYVENCETSAVGRALGNLGIGATTAIASAEEVMSAMEHQDAQQPAQDPVQAAKQRLWRAAQAAAPACGTTPEGMVEDLKASTEWGAKHGDADWLNAKAAVLENMASNG